MSKFSFGKGKIYMIGADGKQQKIAGLKGIEINFNIEYQKWHTACERELAKINRHLYVK